MPTRGLTRGLGLALGYAADTVLGDPARWHPVAGFGRAAETLEARTYADRRDRGVLHVALLVGSAWALGAAVERAGRDRPLLHVVTTAAVTWTVLGGTSLDREAAAVGDHLAAGRLTEARARLTHLVGRDTRDLDEAGVARATLESLAENTSDAVVAPLVWGAVAGVPGLLGHRAANTLDAMVGHHSRRYERFGWAAARLDDVLNLPGARLTAALAAALAPGVGGSTRAALATWRRDAAGHPSPNAGPVEASFAGALGVRLGGVNVYGERIEDRHVLGDGPPPTGPDLDRGRVLARRVDLATVMLCAALASAPRPRRRPRR